MDIQNEPQYYPPILISIAALIHKTGTRIYTFIHAIVTLIYTNSLMISFLALGSIYLWGNPKDRVSYDCVKIIIFQLMAYHCPAIKSLPPKMCYCGFSISKCK